MPAAGRPEAARRAGLEGVEKSLPAPRDSTATTGRIAGMLLLCLASRSAHHLVLRSLTPVGLAACRTGATVVVPVVTGRAAAHAGWHAATFPPDATDPPHWLERHGSGDRRGGHGRPRRRQGRVRSQQLAAWPRRLRPGRRPGRRAPGPRGAAAARTGNPAGRVRRPPPGTDHDHRRPTGVAGDRRRAGTLARRGAAEPGDGTGGNRVDGDPARGPDRRRWAGRGGSGADAPAWVGPVGRRGGLLAGWGHRAGPAGGLGQGIGALADNRGVGAGAD